MFALNAGVFVVKNFRNHNQRFMVMVLEDTYHKETREESFFKKNCSLEGNVLKVKAGGTTIHYNLVCPEYFLKSLGEILEDAKVVSNDLSHVLLKAIAA